MQPAGILVLSSADPDQPDISAMIDEMRSRIQEGNQGPVHFDVEYLGPSLLAGDPSFRKQIAPFFAQKYRGRSFRLVIAIGEKPEEFAERFASRMYPGAALLFVLVSPPDRGPWLAAKPGRTGVIRRLNYLPTLEIALRQNPGTRRVLVVAGSSEFEKMELETASEQFQPYALQLQFQYLTDLKLGDTLSRLSQPESNSIVLFLNFLVDGAGEQLIPSRVLPALAQAANRPVYAAYASFIGKGAVGGSAADLAELGRAAGQAGARILNGERPENIPVITGEFQRLLFDWRQMQRWGIGPDRLPAGSTVLNRPNSTSTWQRHKALILVVLGVLLAETLLLILLLWMRAQRRRAEKESSYRLKLERLTANLAANFVGLPPQLFNAEVDRAFELLMHTLDLDAVSLFTISGNGSGMDLLYSRKAPGVPPWPLHIDGQQFPWTMDKLLKGEAILVSGLQSLPAEAPALKAALQQQGMRSFVSLPLRADGAVFGVVSFACGDKERQWTPELTQYLQTVADIFGGALRRQRAEEALRESERRFRLMADSAPVLMWMTGPDKGCTDVNREWLEFTGRVLEQELGEGWAEGVHPEDREHCLNHYGFAFEARQRFAMEYRLRRHDGQYRWVLDHGVPRYLGDGTFAGYIGCCTDISDQKEAEMARLELSGRLIHAQEEESARIARELHDDINQRLALLANGLQQMQARHGAGRGLHAESQLPPLLQLTNEISTDLQHLSHQLHPSKLQYLGLAAAVRDLCQEISRQHKIEVECQVRDVPRELDENVSLSLFRTAQESLRNVVRHSHAKQAKVELTGESGVVRLRVSDDGIGFNPEDSPSRRGLGLVSMRERLRSVGGEFSIWSRPSLGTQVEGTAPAIPRRAWNAEILKPTA